MAAIFALLRTGDRSNTDGVRMTGVRLGMVGVMAAVAAVTLACGGSRPSKGPAGVAPVTATGEDAKSTELERVLDRVMAPPEIRAERGFTARVLIPPGEMYDPLFMRDQVGTVWISDDGGQAGAKGGQILAIDRQGKVSPVVALGRLLPVVGFDIAPASFAPYRGQVFSVAQAEVTHSGTEKNHIVQRIDPMTEKEGSAFCTLPMAGTEGQGIAGTGMDARFGPEGSPFAGKFFAITLTNNTVYQATSDGRCTPFVTFDQQKWGKPAALAFSPDGQHMLVSTSHERQGAIVRVRPDGTVEAEPLVRAEQVFLAGMAYAPATFGDFAGQLFMAAIRRGSEKEQQTHAPPANGQVYRLSSEGELKLVATGLRVPLGVHFVEHRLWVSDVSGDFIGGIRRELPDGFVVEITPAP